MAIKKIIVFVGKMGSGKSTLAKYVAENYNGEIISYADPIRNMFKAIGLNMKDMSPEMKEMPSDTLSGRTPRYALQTLGTEWARNLMDTNFWVNLWKLKVIDLQLNSSCRMILTDDCRFLNEAAAVREVGGILIRVNRNNFRTDDATKHKSETEMELIKTDYEVDNEGELGDTIHALDMIIHGEHNG